MYGTKRKRERGRDTSDFKSSRTATCHFRFIEALHEESACFAYTKSLLAKKKRERKKKRTGDIEEACFDSFFRKTHPNRGARGLASKRNESS